MNTSTWRCLIHLFAALLLASTARAATFTVTSVNDGGPGSLRQAIMDANANAGLDTIAFNIPPNDGAVKTILLTNTLTAISGSPVIIDGYTQPGASTNTLATGNDAILLIELTTTNNSQGINFLVTGCTVRGLVINGFAQGVSFQAATQSNVVEGCFIGTDPTGSMAGQHDGGNAVGINCASSRNRIGGTEPWQRNLIGGNTSVGIEIPQSAFATDNLVQGNYIGTDFQGILAIPNHQGIRLYSARNTLTNNVISGNTLEAIDLTTGASNTIQHCAIGLNAIGTTTLANGDGIYMNVASFNKITSNTIVGNAGFGISLGSGHGNRIDGNFIGTDATGTQNFGNGGDGISLGGGAGTNNTIGVTAGNLIAFNGDRGIQIGSGPDYTTVANNLIYSNTTQGITITTVRNRLSANSIFGNAELGIDLIGAGGVDANDACDPDTGANNLQNFPVLTSATTTTSGVTTITGTLNSAASTTYRLEFFANTACDPSGNGEGEFYLGYTNLTTAANCHGSFTFIATAPVFGCDTITATATDPAGNTSEFSACIPVVITCVAPPSGMVGWWTGDGNANDLIAGHNGTLSNGTTFAAGVVGQAFQFDGQDDFVWVADDISLDPTNGATIDAWVYFDQKPSAAGHHMHIAGKSGYAHDLDLTVLTDDRFRFYIGVGHPTIVAVSSTLVQTGVWYHVAGTWTAHSNVSIYVNGVLEQENVLDATREINGNPFTIGETLEFPGRHFTGKIDEVELFDRPLSADEVRRIACAGELGKCKPSTTNTLPQIFCPGNVITNTAPFACSQAVNFNVSATGAPTPVVTANPPSGSTFPKGTTLVNCVASNSVGTNHCSFTVTVLDNEPPTLLCPPNITTNVAAGATNAVVNFTMVDADDNCPGGSLTVVPPGGSAFPLGTTPVNARLIDAAGNTNTCSFTVTVTAGTACTINCPSPIFTNTAPGLCGATVTFNVGSSGSCATIVATPPSGSFFPKGVTQVTVTTNGLTVCTFPVTVTDTQPPTITCPADITTTNSIVTYTVPVSDNCGIAATNCTPASGSTFPVGATPVTCIATDTSGNTSTCSFNVVVSPTACECPDLTATWSNFVQTCKLKNEVAACKVKAELLVRNIGCVDARTSFIRYYLSDDASFDEGDIFLKQVATGTIKLDKPKKRTLSAKLPEGVSGTGQFILAVLDADHTLTECEEDNNIIVFGPVP